MLTHNEIKAIMVKTFKDEHCCFTEQDIKVGLINSHIEIQIKGYEHITYMLFPEKCDCEFLDPFMVTTYECMCFSKHPSDKLSIGCHGSDTDYPFKEALEWLAYHISSCVHHKTIVLYKEIWK